MEPGRAIYRLRFKDAKLERVVALDSAASTLWGSGLAPDDSPVVTRDIGLTEIYALDLKLP